MRELRAPNGTRIEIRGHLTGPARPPTRHALVVQCQDADGGGWGMGRAGMLYRDLVPGRLGGAIIASHIRIPNAGPVPDDVHYHIAAFQLIYCYRGWVDLVYEDQGPPLPPRIRGLPHSAPADPPPGARVVRRPGGDRSRDPGRSPHRVRPCAHPPHRAPAPGSRLRRAALPSPRRARRAVAGGPPPRLRGLRYRNRRRDRRGGERAGRPTRRDGGGNGAQSSHDADILFTFVLAGRMTLRGRKEKRP